MKYIASAAFLAALLKPTQQLCSDFTADKNNCVADAEGCDWLDNWCVPRTCTDRIFDLASLQVTQDSTGLNGQYLETYININPTGSATTWDDTCTSYKLFFNALGGAIDTQVGQFSRFDTQANQGSNGDNIIQTDATQQLQFAIDLTTSDLQECVQDGQNTNLFHCSWTFQVFHNGETNDTLQASWTIKQDIEYQSETEASLANVEILKYEGDLTAAAVEVVIESALNLCTDNTFSQYVNDPAVTDFKITLGDIMHLEHKIVSEEYRRIMHLEFVSAKLTNNNGEHIVLLDERANLGGSATTDQHSGAYFLKAKYAEEFTLTVTSAVKFGDSNDFYAFWQGRNDFNVDTDDYSQRRFLTTTTQTFNRRSLNDQQYKDNSSGTLTLYAEPVATEEDVKEEETDNTVLIVAIICSLLMVTIITIGGVVCYKSKQNAKTQEKYRQSAIKTTSDAELKSATSC